MTIAKKQINFTKYQPFVKWVGGKSCDSKMIFDASFISYYSGINLKVTQ